MGVTYNPRIVTDGLVLCLDAANTRSYPGTGTTWTDLKGTNNGTLTNGPTFSSDDGGSLVLDGTNDYIDLGDPSSNFFSSIAGTDQVSIGGWFKNNTTVSSQKIIFDSGNSEKLQIDVRSTGIAFLTICSSTVRISRQSMTTGVWYHFMGTYNGSKMIGYINGVKYTESSQSGNFGSDSNFSAIGRFPSNTSYMWPGSVSGFVVYNRSLAADEILQNYLATKGRYK